MGMLNAAERAALKIEARGAEKVAARAAIKGGMSSVEHKALNIESAAMRKMATRGAGPRRSALTEANRLRRLPPPPKARTGYSKYAHQASQWAKGHKKMVVGAGGLALAGTAFSNNTGVGSSKGTPNQARGMYGF